jgi:hypothetical protein
MDLSWLLTTASLLVLVYAVFVWLRGQLPQRESVKTSAPRRSYKRRSAGSNVLNAGSGHQERVRLPVNVQPNVQGSGPLGTHDTEDTAAGDSLLIQPNELHQLAEALKLRSKGATVEEALSGGFGVRKGGSAGYKRAKALFDAATQPPA